MLRIACSRIGHPLLERNAASAVQWRSSCTCPLKCAAPPADFCCVDAAVDAKMSSNRTSTCCASTLVWQPVAVVPAVLGAISMLPQCMLQRPFLNHRNPAQLNQLYSSSATLQQNRCTNEHAKCFRRMSQRCTWRLLEWHHWADGALLYKRRRKQQKKEKMKNNTSDLDLPRGAVGWTIEAAIVDLLKRRGEQRNVCHFRSPHTVRQHRKPLSSHLVSAPLCHLSSTRPSSSSSPFPSLQSSFHHGLDVE
jgi:hypothetical protein